MYKKEVYTKIKIGMNKINLSKLRNKNIKYKVTMSV